MSDNEAPTAKLKRPRQPRVKHRKTRSVKAQEVDDQGEEEVTVASKERKGNQRNSEVHKEDTDIADKAEESGEEGQGQAAGPAKK